MMASKPINKMVRPGIGSINIHPFLSLGCSIFFVFHFKKSKYSIMIRFYFLIRHDLHILVFVYQGIKTHVTEFYYSKREKLYNKRFP